jgi:hypothetical protein
MIISDFGKIGALSNSDMSTCADAGDANSNTIVRDVRARRNSRFTMPATDQPRLMPLALSVIFTVGARRNKAKARKVLIDFEGARSYRKLQISMFKGEANMACAQTGAACGLFRGMALDRSTCSAAGGQPLTAKATAFVFGGATPDTGFLVGPQREVEAFVFDNAGAADVFRVADLFDIHWKEHRRVNITTRGIVAPIVRIPVDVSFPSH